MKIRSVGVDLGGTWLRVCALGARGTVLREVRLPAPPPALLGGALRQLWKAWGIMRVPSLVVGSKGVWRKAARRGMSRTLASLSERLLVMSDVELAHEAVFGGKPGLLILAGTGSIALARDGRGGWRRAGGLGPSKGDAGSGFWIGREFLRRTGRKIPPLTPQNVRKIAALAEKVLKDSARDPLYGGIAREAQGHLLRLLRDLSGKPTTKTIGVGYAGSLFQDEGFRRGFFRKLRASAPGQRFSVSSARHPVARAAAFLGLWRERRLSPIIRLSKEGGRNV